MQIRIANRWFIFFQIATQTNIMLEDAQTRECK